MTALSVNLNKIAVLRNSRGGELPCILKAARTCIQAGCQGITVHPRPDARHVTADDVHALAGLLAASAPDVEFNIEGNPFAAPREGYPGLLPLVAQVRPAQCTLVPDSDGQITSDHGFDLARDLDRLAAPVAELKSLGCRVSVFVDAGALEGFGRAREIGIDRIEIYTGPFAEAVAGGDPAMRAQALAACVATATAAREAGLAVNAGHDLDQGNLPLLVAAIPWLAEVSIGHALIADALYLGLDATVRAYLAAAVPSTA